MDSHNAICAICGKKYNNLDWADYDKNSGRCKCRECVYTPDTNNSPLDIPYPRNKTIHKASPEKHFIIQPRRVRWPDDGEIREVMIK